ncbi:MAG: glycosyltransferase family 1 protein, partial [Planctomycetes bacterium]|nr:glycosyltransferase family 1 protein [Planctomycetota bacterium]
SEYYLTVARIVAENNIHKEIEGFNRSKSSKKFVVVGNFNDRDTYTKHLFKLKENNSKIVLLDPIYDEEVLGVLRKGCCAYIHAYEVGGTNPSLLEQMLFKKPIVASDVPFHREVLQDGGIYFKDEDELANCIQKLERGEFDLEKLGSEQIRRLEEEYNWERVSTQYNRLFEEILQSDKSPKQKDD